MYIPHSEDVARLATKRHLNKFVFIKVSVIIGLFKTLCWALILVTRLRFPPGSSIATDLRMKINFTRKIFIPRTELKHFHILYVLFSFVKWHGKFFIFRGYIVSLTPLFIRISFLLQRS